MMLKALLIESPRYMLVTLKSGPGPPRLGFSRLPQTQMCLYYHILYQNHRRSSGHLEPGWAPANPDALGLGAQSCVMEITAQLIEGLIKSYVSKHKD
jgi:hypothetical protein